MGPSEFSSQNSHVDKTTNEAGEQSGPIYIDIYRKALDTNVFKRRANDPFFPFEADEEKIKSIVDPYLDNLSKRQSEQQGDLDSVEVPAGFDFDKEVKEGTKRAVRILFRSGLVSVQAIRGAAKYVGPSNTRYIEDEMDYNFAPTREYSDFLEAQGSKHTRRTIPPPPHSKAQFFSLEVGGVGLKSNAGQYLRLAKELGIPMDVTQAIRLEATRASAHEYGHAITRALENNGLDTLERAQHLGFIESPELFDFDLLHVHDEYLARGIEQAVERRYLSEIGYTPEQINSLFESMHKYYQADKNAAYSFLKYANSLGYTPNEIIKLQNAVVFAATKAYKGDETKFHLWHIGDIIAYRTEPYSEEQLSSLMKTEA